MIAIVVSRADSASEHIGERLLAVGDWERREDPNRPDAEGGGTYYRTDGFELREFDGLHIELDDPAVAFGGGDADGDDVNGDGSADGGGDADGDRTDLDFLVFVSRHAGESGELLTAHVTGNFGPSPYGGEPRTLSNAAPGAEKRVVEALAAHAPAGYDVGIECTHHGPTNVSVPSLFVELGSDEAQWADSDAAEAVARAVLDLRGTGADLVGDDAARHVVGFGGGHYAPRFDRILTETDWGVGHVAADWALEEMGDADESRAVVAKAFQASGTEFAVVDGGSPELESVVDELGFETLSETFLRETTGVPLDLVGRLETELRPVDEGLRFGVGAGEADADGVVTRELPTELLEAANGVDREAVLEALDRTAVAYTTEEGATLVAGRVALREEGDYRAVVDGLAAVLEAKYDTVEVRTSSVIARREAFDPDRAEALGVEPGPAFGRLSAGEAIEVDGERIDPADVRSARERTFPL